MLFSVQCKLNNEIINNIRLVIQINKILRRKQTSQLCRTGEYESELLEGLLADLPEIANLSLLKSLAWKSAFLPSVSYRLCIHCFVLGSARKCKK